MRSFLPSGWRRWTIGIVVVGASLGIIGACNPTKPPPSPQPVCFGGPGSCLTVALPAWTFTTQGEVHTFTVKNNGPDQSELLFSGIFGGNAGPSEYVIVQDNCVMKRLVNGDSCTIGVQTFGVGNGHDAFLVVGSDNSQLDPDLGQRGAKAHLLH